MTEPDLLVALMPVLNALRTMGVRHYVGGSLASSAHGVPRASIDVDVVAELEPRHAGPLAAALHDAYYVPDQRLNEAIAGRTSFNLIHLDTMVKVDVFVAGHRPSQRRAFDRARPTAIEGVSVPVCSVEDTVLAKLEWFRRGGEVSERQWTDVIGVLQVHTALDVDYLRTGASELGVTDLLERALGEARR